MICVPVVMSSIYGSPEQLLLHQIGREGNSWDLEPLGR